MRRHNPLVFGDIGEFVRVLKIRKILFISVYTGFAAFVAHSLLMDPKVSALETADDLLVFVLAGVLFTACTYGAIWNLVRLFRRHDW